MKATVDAYDGKVHLYVFDEPIRFAPTESCSRTCSRRLRRCPPICGARRYPEMIFQVQAEIYRMFHMRDPGDVLQQIGRLGHRANIQADRTG